ncbi:MAG: hypothetical protein JWN98_1379, partial [Abditibacteriota bacterium]|nr:hypothetical protein [Abditibacteriota bacterium]
MLSVARTNVDGTPKATEPFYRDAGYYDGVYYSEGDYIIATAHIETQSAVAANKSANSSASASANSTVRL